MGGVPHDRGEGRRGEGGQAHGPPSRGHERAAIEGPIAERVRVAAVEDLAETGREGLQLATGLTASAGGQPYE